MQIIVSYKYKNVEYSDILQSSEIAFISRKILNSITKVKTERKTLKGKQAKRYIRRLNKQNCKKAQAP